MPNPRWHPIQSGFQDEHKHMGAHTEKLPLTTKARLGTKCQWRKSKKPKLDTSSRGRGGGGQASRNGKCKNTLKAQVHFYLDSQAGNS